MSSSAWAVIMLLAGTPASSDSDIAASPSPAPVDQALPSLATDSPPDPQQATTESQPIVTETGHSEPESTGATEGEEAITVTASRRHIAADPLSDVNVASYAAIQFVDKAVVAPTAKTYERIVPKPVRNGLRNVLINLAEPVVFLNYLLQFKPGKAAETAGRFGLNSTIGVAGLFDMARRKPFNLPYRQNGFANTMGYHGVKTGPFLFVPILGPTTARDFVGRMLDLLVLPTAFGKPFNKPLYTLTTGTVKSMNDRVEFDEELQRIKQSSDPYVASRDLYLKRREREIAALHSERYRASHPEGQATQPATAP